MTELAKYIKVHCWGESMWFTPIEGTDKVMVARLENEPFIQTGLKKGQNYTIQYVERDGLAWWEPADQSLRVEPDMEKVAQVFNKGSKP